METLSCKFHSVKINITRETESSSSITMSGKLNTTGLLKPSTALAHRSPSASNSRTHSKERQRRTSISGSIPHTHEGNLSAYITTTTSTTTHTTTTNSSISTTSTATTTLSSKPTSPSIISTSSTTTSSPTIIKTAPPTRNTTGSPLLCSASLHSRAAAISTASSSTTRSVSNSGSSSNNQTRLTSTTNTTHLSPWPGPTTYTSNSNNKKTSASATADSRLVVLGSPAVGKSALVVRLLTGRFIWEYDPTLEAAYRHHTTVDDDSAVLDILDTAGQSEGLVNEAHARWGDGFILAFSLTDRRSFNTIKEIHESVASARQSPNFSCVIIANKTDLGHLAEVSEDEASDMAGELGASLFLTSACDGGPAIHAAFSELHRDVIRRRWTRRRRSSAKTVIEGFYKMFSR